MPVTEIRPTTQNRTMRLNEDAPLGDEGEVQTYTGGVLGDRVTFQREDGTWVNADATNFPRTAVMADSWRRQCLPLLFLQERIHAERDGKVDMLIEEKRTRLNPDCTLYHLGFGFTRHAHGQLASVAGMPASYFHKLRASGRSNIASACINAGIIDRKLMERYDEQGEFLLRLRHNVVRGLQTDTYGIYDDHQFIDDLIEALPQDMVVEIMCNHIWSDGNNVKFSFMVPDRWTQEPEGVWGVGVQGANSEVAQSSLYLRPYLYSGHTDSGFSYNRIEPSIGLIEERHYGQGLAVQGRVRKKIQENMERLLQASQSLLVQLHRARSINVPNPSEVLAVLCRKEGLSMETGREWFKHLRTVRPETGVITAYGLCVALTVMAREKGTEARSEIESAAGQMLAPGLTVSPERLQSYWMALSAAGNKLQKSHPDVVRNYTTGPVVPIVQGLQG